MTTEPVRPEPDADFRVGTASSAQPVRIGLVGYGKGGRVFHAPIIDWAPGCELVGVVTRSPERAAQVARDRPGVTAYHSLADLVTAGVDAVSISTPLDTHVDLALEAISLGVPVLVDKPFAPTAAQGQLLIDAAERAGVLLTVYQNRRWDADFLSLRSILASDALGELRGAELAMEEQPAPPPFSMAGGGGTSLDFGSHVIDQALTLFGPVRTVSAVRRRLAHRLGSEGSGSEGSGAARLGAPGSEADDRFHAVLTHESGLSTEVTANWDLHDDGRPRFRVHGELGTVVVPADDGQSARLLRDVAGVASPGVASPGAPVEGDFGDMRPTHRPMLWRRGVPEELTPTLGAWSELYAQWGRAVRGEGPVPVDPRDSVAALRVIEAIRLAADTAQSVHLPSL